MHHITLNIVDASYFIEANIATTCRTQRPTVYWPLDKHNSHGFSSSHQLNRVSTNFKYTGLHNSSTETDTMRMQSCFILNIYLFSLCLVVLQRHFFSSDFHLKQLNTHLVHRIFNIAGDSLVSSASYRSEFIIEISVRMISQICQQ